MRRSLPFVMFVTLILYYELFFHGISFTLADGNLVFICGFSVVYGCLFGIITSIFPCVVSRIIATALVLLIGILFTAQYIYHEVFDNYLSVAGTIRFGNQAADNAATVAVNIRENLLYVVLFVLPVAAAIVCIWKFMDFKRLRWWINLAAAVVTLAIYITVILAMRGLDYDVYSAYAVYKKYSSVDLAVEKLGVMESFAVDIREGVSGNSAATDSIDFASTGDNSSSVSENTGEEYASENADGYSEDDVTSETATTEAPVDTAPNTLDLDFDAIDELAGSDAVSSLSDYFQSISPTNKNEYTGMFEDYNVIWITAEGYSGYALKSGLFPTLDKLTNEGFVFENYYQPLWYGSTLGGEYANLMGSPTKNGGYLSMCRAAKNENGMLFSMGNMLKRLGYACYACHDNDYTYYDRNITHPALGYEWIASGSGLDYQKNENGNDIWPQSDLVMLEETFDELTQTEPFHIYYLTVSGHVPYGYGGANAMSEKNKEIVADLEYSDTTNAYLAAQYELEQMMSELLDKLEEKDMLDNTVIVLAGDHVPYDNMEILDELAGETVSDSLDAYRSSLIIWSASMNEPVSVDKVCSSIDILPTMLNLMGLSYDSRLIIGRDILSDSGGLVLFADRSFITDEYQYYSVTNTVVSGTANDAELQAMQLYVADKFTAADSITETGYYTYVAEYLGIGQ